MLLQLIIPYLLASMSTILCFQPGIKTVGRWNISVADWSATALKFSIISNAIKSPEVCVSFNYCGNCKYYIDVSINCKSFEVLPVSNTTTSINFTIPNHTYRGRYDITITKRSEPNTGVMMIEGIRVLNSNIITTDTMRNRCDDFRRKMIVIGDSINIGYGVEGEDPCPYSADTENVLHAYGYLTATRLSSLVHVIAWSGRGVVRNYGEEPGEVGSLTVPQLYNRTLATAATSAQNLWDPNNFQADVVMIDLGTNDYSTEPHPSDAEFTAGLSSFVSALQGDYPGAKVLLLCPYNLTDLQCGNVRSAATATGVTYLRLPTALVSSLGCNYHPDKTSQEALSDFITPLVETLFT